MCVNMSLQVEDPDRTADTLGIPAVIVQDMTGKRHIASLRRFLKPARTDRNVCNTVDSMMWLDGGDQKALHVQANVPAGAWLQNARQVITQCEVYAESSRVWPC